MYEQSCILVLDRYDPVSFPGLRLFACVRIFFKDMKGQSSARPSQLFILDSWYGDIVLRQSRLDGDREFAANERPILSAIGPGAQLKAKCAGTQIENQCLRWRILGHERVCSGNTL
jgi:hypothetical protein